MRQRRWLTAGHEQCLFPCSENTTFDKFKSLKGKVLPFDVAFNTFTFIHYEDFIKNELPLPLCRNNPMTVTMLDSWGHEVGVDIHVFSDTAVRREALIFCENIFSGRAC